jgi:hypothetical protein
MFFNDGSDWGIFWFLPGMVYFVVFSIFYFILCIVGLICVFHKKFHQNLDHTAISLVAVSYCLEFLLLTTVFIQSLVMFCGHYDSPTRFENIRKSAIIVLLIHLIFKFANIFLSFRYADQMFET